MSYSCRVCGSGEGIAASRVLHHDWICTRCYNKKRDADPARYMTRKLGENLRHRGVQAPYPGIAFVRDVIAKCEGKSVLSGERENLCVVMLEDGTGVLLTSKESHSYTRYQNLSKTYQQPIPLLPNK